MDVVMGVVVGGGDGCRGWWWRWMSLVVEMDVVMDVVVGGGDGCRGWWW